MSVPSDNPEDEERTDPESPTGLRRSIAAQSGELECLRKQVRELTERLEFQRAIAADAVLGLGKMDSALVASGLKLNYVRRQLVFAHAVNIALALVLVALLAGAWLSMHPFTL